MASVRIVSPIELHTKRKCHHEIIGSIVVDHSPSALAEDQRQLDAHEHGVGQLNIAIEGNELVMELTAPGADIVGFEHAAESDADKQAVAAALELLEQPLSLLGLPEAAGCTVTHAHAALESDAHEEHDEHDEHHHDKKHEEHAEHDEHHEDHEHEEHDEHAEHDEHHHDEKHEEHGEATHSEFHAEYALTCADPSAFVSHAVRLFHHL